MARSSGARGAAGDRGARAPQPGIRRSVPGPGPGAPARGRPGRRGGTRRHRPPRGAWPARVRWRRPACPRGRRAPARSPRDVSLNAARRLERRPAEHQPVAGDQRRAQCKQLVGPQPGPGRVGTGGQRLAEPARADRCGHRRTRGTIAVPRGRPAIDTGRPATGPPPASHHTGPYGRGNERHTAEHHDQDPRASRRRRHQSGVHTPGESGPRGISSPFREAPSGPRRMGESGWERGGRGSCRAALAGGPARREARSAERFPLPRQILSSIVLGFGPGGSTGWSRRTVGWLTVVRPAPRPRPIGSRSGWVRAERSPAGAGSHNGPDRPGPGPTARSSAGAGSHNGPDPSVSL